MCVNLDILTLKFTKKDKLRDVKFHYHTIKMKLCYVMFIIMSVAVTHIHERYSQKVIEFSLTSIRSVLEIVFDCLEFVYDVSESHCATFQR